MVSVTVDLSSENDENENGENGEIGEIEDQFVLQYPKDSVEFHRFNIVFLGHLQAIYAITYSDELTLDAEDSDQWIRYLHYPMGRCACLVPDPSDPEDTFDAAIESINSNDWCDEPSCPVAPILNEGYLSGYRHIAEGRHILLGDHSIDDWFLHQRAAVGPGYAAIFVCQVRSGMRLCADLALVIGNENILAIYLAIVRVTE